MKLTRNLLLLVILAAFLAVPAQAQKKDKKKSKKKGDAKPELVLATEADTVSYAHGLNFAYNLKVQKIDLDLDLFMRGIKEGIDSTSKMTNEEAIKVLQAFYTEIQKKQQAEKAAADKAKYAASIAEGEAYLKENGAKSDVITTASGLQYRIITKGEGAIPTASNKVVTHYKGTLIDGKEFDSSYSRGQPATFPVTGVIPGWVEALQLMPVGSKWELTIPYELAYGERGAGASIPPYSVLIFEIELLDIAE